MNPFDHQKAYATMDLGPHRVPGHITKITGCGIQWDWETTKSQGTSGGTDKFKGQKKNDSIKVECSLTTPAHHEELEAFRVAMIPPEGKAPPAFDARNAVLNNGRIKSVTINEIGQEEDQGGGQWKYVLDLRKFAPPKPTATGAPKGAKGTTKWVEPDAKSPADKAVDDLLKKAKDA